MLVGWNKSIRGEFMRLRSCLQEWRHLGLSEAAQQSRHQGRLEANQGPVPVGTFQAPRPIVLLGCLLQAVPQSMLVPDVAPRSWGIILASNRPRSRCKSLCFRRRMALRYVEELEASGNRRGGQSTGNGQRELTASVRSLERQLLS